jgi:predicted double-glycine peptidase
MVRAVACRVVVLCVGLAIGLGSGLDFAWAANGLPDPDQTPQTIISYVRPALRISGRTDMSGEIGYPRGLRPLTELRWEGIVRQRVDAGCGPASLATLYTYYLDLPITEEEIARSVTAEALRRGRGRPDIQARGYTLGDLKRVAERGRLVTAAFRGTTENLHELRIPVVTHINIRGYGHFVVLRGMVGDRAIIADPSFGNMTVPLGQFRDIWSGVMLAVGRPKAPAERPDFDPRGGPIYREVDLATFRRAQVPSSSAVLRSFALIQARAGLGNVPIAELRDFTTFTLEKSLIQLNLD